MKPAAIVRLGGLVATASLAGACQLAFGLGDYAGATTDTGATGVTGGGGTGAGGGGSGGATTTSTTTTPTTTSGAGGGSGTAPPPDGTCTCLAALPDGWSFVHVFTRARADGPFSDCGDGTKPAAYLSGAPAGSHVCTPCTCALPDATNCTQPKLLCAKSDDCAAGVEVGAGSDCSVVYVNGACRLSDVTQRVGTCAASGGAVESKADWTSVLSVCPAPPKPDASCAGACVPSGGEGRTCVTRSGSAPCTVPGFERKVEAFATSEDGRGCQACSCSPDFTCSGGAFTLFETAICWGGKSWSVEDTSCNPVSVAYGAKRGSTVASGACAPAGGTPTGSLVGKDEATVCCPP